MKGEYAHRTVVEICTPDMLRVYAFLQGRNATTMASTRTNIIHPSLQSKHITRDTRDARMPTGGASKALAVLLAAALSGAGGAGAATRLQSVWLQWASTGTWMV
ncbi:uncharacterized protein SCHCODRAFT_02608770 [Schizophyllum commune H4-8]|uniref:uncharacterized protein n=1 Tax=Schizophyllum commune (strain H4-8 / FGSC 9210) TaxID=578458 RepID=UPI00215E818C|nr:uncharacterized protein SCHCODRAFT_02608770 [Schizophyllum commune H4-8]KAI5900781.1 hypothetical protein SCHCODRAFT_02608770 [Schizophyllum commune H4-8]